MLQVELQALRQQMQKDWEAGNAEQQEMLRQLHAQGATAAAQVGLVSRLGHQGLLVETVALQMLVAAASTLLIISGVPRSSLLWRPEAAST